MFTFKELYDFSCYDDMPLPSLVTLSARACVLYSEYLLGQLESVVLPMKIARLLVETYDDMGSNCMGMRSRFLAALKDSSGSSPWVFPGNPRVFPDSTNRTPNSVFLRYNTPVDHKLMAEIKRHESRISGLMCNLEWSSSESINYFDYDTYGSIDWDAREWGPVTLSRLTKFITSERMYYLLPTNLLIQLDVRHFSDKEIDLLCRFQNLERLSMTNCSMDVYHFAHRVRSVDTLQHELSPLFTLKKLKHLDLQSYGEVLDAKVTLTTILTEMPDLEYLDVSETNLDEGGLEGLFELRKSRPLKFIGLYNTTHGGCLLPDIPADVVSGTANSDQRAAALETYRDNNNNTKSPLDILDYVPSWEARTNYMIQLLQLSSKKDKLYIRGLITKVFEESNYSNLPPRVLQVLCDCLITCGYHYHHHWEMKNKEGKLLMLLLKIVPKICSQKPSYLGRMLAYFIDCCWDCRYGGLHCSDLNALCVEEYEHLLDVQDESCVCILDILNCHLKNVIWYIESLPSIYTAVSCVCTTRKLYNFVMLLFENVNHSAIEDFKRLFSRIELWESAVKYIYPGPLFCFGCKSSKISLIDKEKDEMNEYGGETSANEIDSSEEVLYSDNESGKSNERSSEYNSTSSAEESVCSEEGLKPDGKDNSGNKEGSSEEALRSHNDSERSVKCYSEHENMCSAEESLNSKDEEAISEKMIKKTKKNSCIVL